MEFPLIAPRPPRLSTLTDGLLRVEASGVFSNNGPEVQAFEREATVQLFGGVGDCLAVGNATLGLMLAIRQAVPARCGGAMPRAGTLALMPALTFAATAQAALWAGLTPLLGDIEPSYWISDPAQEEALLARHGDRVGVIVPYATFGTDLDLDRYAWLARRYDVGVVVDAAASLGTIDAAGRGFGTGAPFAIVYSMHATKTFAVAEGGLIHCGDADRIASLRAMANFGFDPSGSSGARSATLPGINAKLPEVIALMARAKLTEIDAVCEARAAIDAAYRAALPGFTMQAPAARRQATQFMPLLLPPALIGHRAAIVAALAADGVGVGHYFSPHIGEQPLFRDVAVIEPTPVADDIAARMLSLPITDAMTPADATEIAHRLVRAIERVVDAEMARMLVPHGTEHAVAQGAGDDVRTVVIGGGPAGTAMLTAASKQNRLVPLVEAGLAIVERGPRLGAGALGGYAIRSDTTAETFLSAVKDNPHPDLAALAQHPAARLMERYIGELGAPLADTAPLLEATGERLGTIVRTHGGSVLTDHEAQEVRRTADGRWATRVADGHGATRTILSDRIVVATGGYQTDEQVAAKRVAGMPLGVMAGRRLMRSDIVLRQGGIAAVQERLRACRAPRIAIVGASTSAIAAAVLLLKSQPGFAFGAGAITIVHRQPLKPFYPTIAAAHAEGFHDFDENDICPVSGFVLRLAGLRLESRELVLRMLSLGGRTPDPRVTTHHIAGDHDAAARAIIEGADLVIGALGYRPRCVPLIGVDGMPLSLAHHVGRPMVDRHCRLLDATDRPVPGAYGIGLSAGFVPWGRLGGEASFRGQANGLWLWQNDVGQMIVDQLLEPEARAVAA
ncbi:aminotransferase DegT [Sphingomonas melonis TY]|jgi:dTDP-4-amino-4,6-dideoxygalactose transaminase|nr:MULTISPECIES: DegT/DnrJ/EryC1/StrS family aminotransferase [Sphingomonas]AOW22984.1 aminotransferase DegT [Sphingomonas melonis TY]ATI56399.1 aminotransferase DegT [Sphingomonas melonis]KZB95216.1 aminotransferase DegT [Sphingomonas melonis TY]MBI0529901.1 aminotransferase DegT [Sphingomonas sp. TX0522]MBX8846679.1 FAD-dependent oxidoreductase [Sphingomonas melonis]